MMKTLRYFFVAALAMVVGNVMAEDVVFDFTDAAKIASYGLTAPANNSDAVEITTFTAQGYTFTAGGSPSTATRLYKSNPSSGDGVITLRIYNKATLTIKANAGTIKNITVDSNANDGFTASAGTYSAGVWAGDATEVTFTASKTMQIKTITISQDGGVTPPPAPTVIEATVAEALAAINALADGKTTTDEYKVTGYVVGTPDFQRNSSTGNLYGNVNLYIADEKGGTEQLYIYRAKDLENMNFTEETLDRMKEGDQVVFQGKLQKYVKDGATTPELTNGYLISVTAGETPAAEAVVWDFTVLPTETIDGTGNIATNATEGKFVEDEGAAWQAFYNNGALDGAEFMATATQVLEITKGLKWYVNAANKIYYRNYPANYGGKYIFINDGDNATEVEIPAAEGQQIELVASTAKNNKKVTSQDVEETFTDSEGATINGVVIDGTTNYDWKPYILTVKVANPILKFEKNMCIQKITVKDADPTAVESVKTATKVADNQMYNLAGQKVGKDYKGLVIMNGKKFVVK